MKIERLKYNSFFAIIQNKNRKCSEDLNHDKKLDKICFILLIFPKKKSYLSLVRIVSKSRGKNEPYIYNLNLFLI